MSSTETPINTAIITISDTRKPQNDVSGERLAQLAEGLGCIVLERTIVTDEFDDVRDALLRLTRAGNVDLVLTTGGTGFGPRDNAPEATREVIEREAPGIAEAMRRESSSKTPMAMLSRGIAGIAGKTLIINLPGSPNAVEECFEVIRPVLRHAADLVRGETRHGESK
jgi:molybdopterin adenylyltransferase